MILVITGPTGVGKTKLSLELARKYNAEIINADSMQIYKGLNIGTAKVEDKMNIKHHLLDIVNIDEYYSVYNYQIDGRKILNELINSNKNVIIVGGTGLYISALLYDYKFNKESINNNYDDLTNEEIYNKIMEIDSNTKTHINNRQRLVRELNRLLNKNSSNQGSKLLYDTIFIGLTTSRENLYNIIDKRVDKMIEAGLLDEVKQLHSSNIRNRSIMTAIGYKELYQYFDGIISLEESIDLIKKNTRHYAKRQYTWFKNKMNITWFNVDFDKFDNTINEVNKYIEENR
ncbi:MAG: tRNA (adenosine(37)-N6)-dimethylallyltransferase MiaA [Bacilli bacterium]|nr:tRNA (adenosine(37)-N6)-dimethylallyltransferase MiaA [Bacilli bacterium]